MATTAAAPAAAAWAPRKRPYPSPLTPSLLPPPPLPRLLLAALVLAAASRLAASSSSPPLPAYDGTLLERGSRLASGCAPCCGGPCTLQYFARGQLSRDVEDTTLKSCRLGCKSLLSSCRRACRDAVEVRTVDMPSGCGCSAKVGFAAGARAACVSACANAVPDCAARCAAPGAEAAYGGAGGGRASLRIAWNRDEQGSCAPVCGAMPEQGDTC